MICMEGRAPGGHLYPLFFDLAGREALVVGAGTVGARRARGLLESGAAVTMVAPHATDDVVQLARDGSIQLYSREFRPDDVAGRTLVFSATGDARVDTLVSAAARAAGAFVNVADDLDLSDFHVPAVLRSDDVQIAVSTGGSAPGLAGRIRDRVAQSVGPEWGRFAGLLGEVRSLAKTRIEDPARRMEVVRGVTADDVLFDRVSEGASVSPVDVLERAMRSQGSLCERSASAPSELVSIVGAGPGDPALITVAGLNRLRRADVVIYDELVDKRLLEEAPAGAELIPGGRRGWRPECERPGPELLVAKARERGGRRVVRLKGGDPAVFGRLADEIDALRAARVPHEIIPGVTAALAAAAAAGVSLTERGCSSSVTLATAVAEGSVMATTIQYGAMLREGGTLALYMGLRSLGELTDALIEAGVDPETPAAIVSNASMSTERVARSTLGEVAAVATATTLESPALVLVGRSVRRVDSTGRIVESWPEMQGDSGRGQRDV